VSLDLDIASSAAGILPTWAVALTLFALLIAKHGWNRRHMSDGELIAEAQGGDDG